MAARNVITVVLALLVLLLGALGAWLLYQQSLNQDSSADGWLSYQSVKYGIAFDYPAEFEVREDDGGAAINVTPKYPSQAQLRGLLPIKFYLQNYDPKTPNFASTTAYLKDNLMLDLIWANRQGEVEEINQLLQFGTLTQAEATQRLVAIEQESAEKLLELEGRYSFAEEVVNGISVLLHRRDVFGQAGNIYELYADWDGRLLKIYSESPTDLTDRLYRSLKKI